jgi:hypothetical protein
MFASSRSPQWSINVREQPVATMVDPGDVPVTSLIYGSATLAADMGPQFIGPAVVTGLTWTATQEGRFLVAYSAGSTGNATGGINYKIRKNGVQIANVSNSSQGASGTYQTTDDVTLDLIVGDVIDLYASGLGTVSDRVVAGTKLSWTQIATHSVVNGTDLPVTGGTGTVGQALKSNGDGTASFGTITTLVDVSSSAPATVAWGNHTRITSGSPGAIVTLANTSTAAVGDTMEIYNQTAFDLVVAVNGANSIVGSPTDLTLPPNAGVSARIVGALQVELVGIGKPIEQVSATNGHVIIGGTTMLQWGRFNSSVDNDEAFTFPTAFGGVPYMLTATISHNLTTTVNGRVLQSSISATGFSFNREDTIANTDNPTVHFWAVGPAP